MANFGKLLLTTQGIQAQYKAQDGSPLKFTRIAMGSGNFTGNTMTLTKLVTENVSVPISKGYFQSKQNAYIVEGFFTNEGLQTGFEWREIGLFVEGENGSEILYCYANAGNTYDFIPATEDERYAKNVRIATTIGNAENVSFVESEGFLYVDLMTFNSAILEFQNKISELKNGFVPLGNEYGNVEFGNDLNNWKTVGLYNCTSDTTNAPTGDGWGTVFVVSGAFGVERLMQLYYAWNYNKGTLYGRYYDPSDGWTKWKNVGGDAITFGTDRIVINENDDLNNILTCGCYKCTGSGVAATLKNCPTAIAFTMDVVPGTGDHVGVTDATKYQYILQLIRTMDGDEYFRKIYTRPNESDIVYMDWRKVLNSGDCVDNLESTLVNRPLSAKQGFVLNGKIDDRLSKSITAYSSYTLGAALTKAFADVFTSYGSHHFQLASSDGYFYVSAFRASNVAYGTVALNGGDQTMYHFRISSISGGADAVLKKLGEPEVKSVTYTLTSTSGNGKRTMTKDVSGLGIITGYGIASVNQNYNCYDNTVDTIQATCSMSDGVITVQTVKSGGDNNYLTGTTTVKLTVWYIES